MKLKEQIKIIDRPYVIAGPCSAETEEQVLDVCKNIIESGKVNMLRAGIWKPRTRPNSFEGVGSEALPWLIRAGEETGLPVITEVANKDHVEAALKAGFRNLWIGARTTVNPFAVQAIADALKGTDTTIMIKNPVNPDLQLWLGAFERFEKNGIDDLMAIHRGFSFYNHAKYRNVPNWEIPIALKEYRPDIPIICDPSHIGGKRNLLLPLAQKAMDLNFDGLMIETHPDPNNAWSDPDQQVTPEGLITILNSLVLRSQELGQDVINVIEDMREKVSSLDDHLFELLKERMRISEEIGKLKRENNITILQHEHWKKVIEVRMNKSLDYNLTEQFVRQLMDAIHQESIRHQTRVMNPDKSDG